METEYSPVVLDHAERPRNHGAIAAADGFARITGPCGDTMEIWLRIRDGVISNISFMTDGCGTTLAAGSMATELVQSKSPGQAFKNQPAGYTDRPGRAAAGKRALRSSGRQYPESSYKQLPE